LVRGNPGNFIQYILVGFRGSAVGYAGTGPDLFEVWENVTSVSGKSVRTLRFLSQNGRAVGSLCLLRHDKHTHSAEDKRRHFLDIQT
jgi:hypothetical protein